MTDEKPQTPSADAIAKAVSNRAGKGPPPVDQWDPPFCGDLDMRIARDGTWFYLGTPIGRAPLVRLFASVIRKDGDAYFLVTPVEKVGITVDDAPFVATDMSPDKDGLRFTTNVGDTVIAGPDHPIRIAHAPNGEPAPYILIRRNLEALIDRKTFYRMAAIGAVRPYAGEDWFGVTSGGAFFPLHKANELEL